MHPLLRLALAACPADYRREYRESICADIRSRGVNVGPAALDVIYQGLSMRAENIARDIIFGLRSLRKSPLFVTIAVLTIALAIGANVAAASIVRGVLMQPLPYPHPDRLVFIGGTFRGQRGANVDYPDIHDLALRNKAFSGISVIAGRQGVLTGMGRPLTLNGGSVGAAYFKILGIKPRLGRLLGVRDLSTRNIVVSSAFWRTRFGANPDVLGRHIMIDDRERTIVGVAPADLVNPGPGFLERTDYWAAIDPRDRYSTNWRGDNAFLAVGRLKDGVSAQAMRADLSRVAAQLARQYPYFDRGRGFYGASMIQTVVGPYRDVLLMVDGAALLLLIIAAANVSNLLLARATSREHEFAVREAVGAGRRRITAQIATETAILVARSLTLGLLLGWAALRALDRFVLPTIYPSGAILLPGWDHARIDGAVACYITLLAALFTMSVSVAPAMLRRGVRGRNGVRTRKILVIVEIVLATALLAVSGLWVRSFFAMMHAPAGFTERNVYEVQIGALPSDRYGSTYNTLAFTQHVIARLRSLPNIGGAAAVELAGLGGRSYTNYSLTQTADKAAPGITKEVEWNSVTPGFFKLLDIPLFAGRTFTVGDTVNTVPVAIVSRRFAEREFHGVSAAIGRYVSVGQSSGGGFPLRRIVGVVGNIRHSLSDQPEPEVYVPMAQVTYFQEFVVRSNGNDVTLPRDIGLAIARVDPRLPPPAIVSFETKRALDAAPTRVASTVFLILAAVALLVAFAGIYGVVAFSVSRRTREFGIRMALGATRARLAASVMWQTVIEAAIGVVIGLALAVLAGRALGENLYQTAPFDPLTLAVTALILLAACTLATLFPTLRATSLNPAAALHIE